MRSRSLSLSRNAAQMRALLTVATATMVLGLALGALMIPHPASAAAASQSSPEEMVASLDGVETAYARRYVSADHAHGFVDATPSASPAAASNDMTFAEVTILQFATEADAIQAWKLTSGTLVAGAIIGEDPADLAATKVDGIGDDATMYLMADASTTDGDTEADGLLFARSGTMGIVISGRGDTSNAALGERLQAFAAFIIAQPEPTSPVEVVQEGVATGGDFDRMPGPDDTDVLQGLIAMYDYDLLVSNSPILPPNATPDDCACALPPTTEPTPMPACGCTPPKQG